MKKSILIITLISICIGCTASIHSTQAPSNTPYVLLISIDAYRYDYTEIHHPPNLTKFKKEGLSAESLLPVFPSKTFPNHLSIITGLYPEEHGIVGNRFFSPERNKEYSVNDPGAVYDGTWYNGTPLWVVAEKNGIKSACYFWPGSEAEIQGVRPSYYKKWDANIPSKERTGQVIEWLKLPEENRPHFITLYFSVIDDMGHEFGPDSKEVHENIMKLDTVLGELFARLSELKLPLTTIVVSDHGMQTVDEKKVIRIDRLVDIKEYVSKNKIYNGGASMMLYENDPEKKSALYEKLKSKAKHFDVYLKENIPEEWHFKKNERIGDILLVATSPYTLLEKDTKLGKGQHGYLPELVPNMRGIFYAQGPGIKNQVIPPFKNIKVYDFVLRRLGFIPKGDSL